MCNTICCINVICGDKPSVGFGYSMRANIEFGKVGLMGISFLASSGDAGVFSSSDTCGDNDEYVATFPASSLYVTTVGGVSGGLQSDSTVDLDGSETAWSYSGGGGFSSFFTQKDFREYAVSYSQIQVNVMQKVLHIQI